MLIAGKSKCVRHEKCPACAARGQDTHSDNLGVYSDGSAFCFACGYRKRGNMAGVWSSESDLEINDGNASKESVLPRDFTREVPAAGWRWLLQWGLPYSYWKPHCGYSPSYERLVFPVGTPTKFSVGRFIGNPKYDAGEERRGVSGEDDCGGQGSVRGTVDDSRGKGKAGHQSFLQPTKMHLPWVSGQQENLLLPNRKWYVWGDRHGFVNILGSQASGGTERVVLVEDLISAHKVAQVTTAIPLFGTFVSDEVLKTLKGLNRPVTLWLDADQYQLLPKKINRLQALLGLPVDWIWTEKDPKCYSIEKIKELLG